MRYCYEIKDGQNESLQKYGIEAARVCGVPAKVVDKATEVYELLCRKQIESSRTVDSETNQDNGVASRKLLHHLSALRYAGLSHPGKPHSS